MSCWWMWQQHHQLTNNNATYSKMFSKSDVCLGKRSWQRVAWGAILRFLPLTSVFSRHVLGARASAHLSHEAASSTMHGLWWGLNDPIACSYTSTKQSEMCVQRNRRACVAHILVHLGCFDDAYKKVTHENMHTSIDIIPSASTYSAAHLCSRASMSLTVARSVSVRAFLTEARIAFRTHGKASISTHNCNK